MFKLAINNYKIYITLFVFTNLFSLALVGQDRDEINYKRFIDSADIYIDESSSKALSFLDSIPEPLEKNVAGRLADYYSILVLIQDEYKEYEKTYESLLLALKYAELEKNYRIAGESSLELFSSIYFTKRDSSAYKYLTKSKHYYELCDYQYGLIEVEQMYQYVLFLDGEYEACNILILDNLDKYRLIKDEGYFHMFALYMLTSNYIYLEDFDKAHLYFNEFKKFKNNTTIVKYNYLSFEVAINMCFADVNFYNEQIDSTFHYVEKSQQLRDYMGGDVLKDYFKLYTDLYKLTDDLELYDTYMDSLFEFDSEMLKNAVDANIHANDRLQQIEAELKAESDKKYVNQVILFVLFFVLIIISVLYLIFYRKSRSKLEHVSKEVSHVSYLKTNNEKLALKVLGYEEYIANLKKEVKDIATINDVSIQREKISELYKNLHHNSSTLLNKGKNHLELINDLNIDFFEQIQLKYPQLNESEIIICYYLFIGFNNKEIAVFINVSVRAIESKRYRIRKKINLNHKETSLLDHLRSTFNDIKSER